MLQSNPFIRTRDTTQKVMLDVIIALVPAVIMVYVAFGLRGLSTVAVSVGSALVAEYIFSLVFLGRNNTLADLSAIVTGLLLAFTLGAFTPLHVVAFGAAAAVVFGKLMTGGTGTNRFNPALVGREFMTVFFPSVMTSGAIWYDYSAVNHSSLSLTGGWFDQLLFNPSGALGEYSIAALFIGGLYLIARRRISWHIPTLLFAVFAICIFVSGAITSKLSFSLGGLMLGAIFMATDMPTSATSAAGKCYYGGMIGLTAFFFIVFGQRYEYMSFSILLLNAFAPLIDHVFRPRAWGEENGGLRHWAEVGMLTAAVIVTFFIVVVVSSYGYVSYLVYLYILYTIARYAFPDKLLMVR